MNRVITYIDGFNLYFGLCDAGWKRFLWLNLRTLSHNLLKPGQNLVRTKYFTSRVSSTPQDPNKPKRQGTYLEALETLSDLDIFYGHYLQKEVKCFKCGATWFTHEEKMTDVNIAVELMNDAYQDSFDTAMIISGDSDLTGPVQALRKQYPMKKIVVAFPPKRVSSRLKHEVTASFVIGRKKFKESLFPDQVVKTDGYVLQKPESWK